MTDRLYGIRNPTDGVRSSLVWTILLSSAGFLAGPAGAVGQESREQTPKRLTIPRLNAAVTIDGRLDEAVWQEAVRSSLARNDGSGPGREGTEVRLFYDESALYLAWICEDSDIQATFTERDSRFWEEEVAEFFVTPEDLTRYVELEWNPLGGVFDAIIHNTLDDSGISQGIEGDWSYTAAGMTSAATVQGTVGDGSDRDVQWVVEVRIPFSDLAVSTPETGDTWRANLYRYSRGEGHEIEELAWSPTLSSVHEPSRFGYLVFGGTAPDRAAQQSERAGESGGISFSDIAEPRPGDWPTYHGHLSGNRHSPLDQIDTDNVSDLALRWLFPVLGSGRLQVTPVVVDGIMYVTTANQVFALDAVSGRQIWHYSRPRTPELVGDAAGGINRGVAVLGDRVFLATDHAHLIALHRVTGDLLWDVEMADYREHYGATSAPLVIKDLVVSGTSGGDEGARGFVAAFTAATGEEVWRFWTAPLPGEPLSETWLGRALEHACAAAWLTGTYDPEADLLYWTTGNPCPDFNGDERLGDNLYSSSVLALDPDDGALEWYYQYTPHDLHDWDAQQTAMLIDAPFGGTERKLLAQASRNGFFYVLDRLTGELLLAEPFVQNLTWASGIGPDGRPVLIPGAEPSFEGVRACPAIEGATNWMSSAYSAATGLFYVMALEKCNIYTKSSEWWREGESFYGGSTRRIPGEPGKKYLRALDLDTGQMVWEIPQTGPANTWGGVLSTAGGLVFFGDDSGAFAAAAAADGHRLWHFQANQRWKASPMTYTANGKQFVAIAAGSNILAFALP